MAGYFWGIMAEKCSAVERMVAVAIKGVNDGAHEANWANKLTIDKVIVRIYTLHIPTNTKQTDNHRASRRKRFS